MKRYCSYCLKPCQIILRDDSFDHAFGTQTVKTPVPDCHPFADLLTREEWAKEVQQNWDFRHAAREHYKEPPPTEGQVSAIFREILGKYIERAA